MPKITRIKPGIKALPAKKKVAAYARVSKDTERLLHSVSAQVSYYSDLIQKNPEWEYAGVYADSGITGTLVAGRSEFGRLLEDCEAGKIDIILCKSISRFARNTVDLLNTVRHLKDIGVEVRFEKEQINSMSGDGELMLSILASFAQEESRSISENVKWGIHKRFKNGEIGAANKHIYGEFLAGLSFIAIARKLEGLGIKSPAGNDHWQACTVKSILTNEKYKGCALLQKCYTEDYLTKKIVVNDGAVPQYYVEDSHPAIIDPAVFDRVQDLIELRSKHKHFSGSTIFSTKIVCGGCGEFYGPKVWHSNDKYRRVIWQCNAKYKDRKKCRTPHLTEDEIRDAFIRAVNSLITGRKSLLADLREIQETYSGTAGMEEELRSLDERLNREADAVQELIAQNARVAQNQDEYSVRYDALVAQYETTKAQRDALAAEIRQKGIRWREFERFIMELEKLPDVVTEFDEALWGSLVETVTVYSKEDIRFLLPCGTKINA